MNEKKVVPLVYACSGASSAAQMANHIALRLDRLQAAEMSCIAGVGGDVKPLVKTARSGRPIIALDGCPLQCVAKILARHGLTADKHVDLSELGVKKRPHEDFEPQEAAHILARIQSELNAMTTVKMNGASAVQMNSHECSHPATPLISPPPVAG